MEDHLSPEHFVPDTGSKNSGHTVTARRFALDFSGPPGRSSIPAGTASIQREGQEMGGSLRQPPKDDSAIALFLPVGMMLG